MTPSALPFFRKMKTRSFFKESANQCPIVDYWWSAAAVWDAMIEYWALTGDDSYNDIVQQALAWQVGPTFDYMPPNQTKNMVC